MKKIKHNTERFLSTQIDLYKRRGNTAMAERLQQCLDDYQDIKLERKLLVAQVRRIADWWKDRKAEMSYLTYDSEMRVFDEPGGNVMTAGDLDELLYCVQRYDMEKKAEDRQNDIQTNPEEGPLPGSADPGREHS